MIQENIHKIEILDREHARVHVYTAHSIYYYHREDGPAVEQKYDWPPDKFYLDGMHYCFDSWIKYTPLKDDVRRAELILEYG